MKICSKCKHEKPLGNFYIRRDGLKEVYRNECKECIKAMVRGQRVINGDEIRAREKRYNDNNKELRKMYHKKYCEANKEKLKAKDREKYKKYYPNNRSGYAKRTALRRARKIQATPKWLSPDQLNEIAELYKLSEELKWLNNGKKLHVDHIVPLTNKKVCGLHVPWNLQIIPAELNFSKGNKFNEDRQEEDSES